MALLVLLCDYLVLICSMESFILVRSNKGELHAFSAISLSIDFKEISQIFLALSFTSLCFVCNGCILFKTIVLIEKHYIR